MEHLTEKYDTVAVSLAWPKRTDTNAYSLAIGWSRDGAR
jgi:hypothetical protein